MIVEIPDDNSIIKWKMNDDDEWKSTEIIDLIKAYEKRPQGDLISREALKEAISYHCEYLHDNTMDLEDILDLINHVSTVPLPDFKAGYKQAIIDGKTNFTRPQGEWINPSENLEFSNREFFYDCSICGNTQMDETNFCPNCGADMRGSAE